ncbi:MAG: EAL domain-containing protein [Acidimicrobiales bacterium]
MKLVTMCADVDPVVEHHISGLYTTMLMESLLGRLSADDVANILARAGERRSIADLSQSSTWNSYAQFRRLLQEAKIELGHQFGKRANLVEIVTVVVHTEISGTIQALGSPGKVLATRTGTNAMVPIRRYETTEVAPNEWTVREHFVDGFAPYPEYCEFSAGQYALLPLFFGLPQADVIEEACQCRGDDTCLFRIRWDEVDPAQSRVEYLEMRTQVLEARLEQLQGMVTDLASNERYEDVLQGIVASSMRSVGATGALLALEPREGSPRKIYSEGLTEAEAEVMAADLLAGSVPGKATAVEVVSARRRYGVLAIGEQGGLFNSQSQNALMTYGRLAAATLDAADAMDQARHQAKTAQTLLELSTSLSELVSPSEMAAKVARAVHVVIECDCAAVFLDDGDWQATGDIRFRLAACHGFSDEMTAEISAQPYHGVPTDQVQEMGLTRSSWPATGVVRTISAPIFVSGKIIGAVMAGVTADPDRLAITPRIADRLKGLAAQASIAITNARLVEQIRFQAVHDTLTGLPNRALILDRTEQMLARARRSYIPVAALFIDLDGFKEVNDTLGHAIGDRLLQAVAARLAGIMRESDSVGRLGGDEFVVLVDGSTMDAGPELVAERVLSVLRQPFELEDTPCGPLSLTASIGIAAGARSSATELLRDADIALYGAKAAGKDCFVMFRPEMHTVVQDRLLLEMDLREALAAQQYFLVYQPIFNLASGAPTGVEALLRWRHPTKGVVQPDDFIPILELSGLIAAVGRWVLAEACRQGARWHGLGYQLDISVNISARQLENDDLIRDVTSALRVSGLDPRSLIVELTETAIMRNTPDVVRRLLALKAMGVRVAIDDFGTGYSSLAYLQQFPVDSIKIDRSFISSMADSPEAGVLIRSLVQLGKTLGLETLAEGIEATGQYAQLAREHCDSGQGYLFGRPLETGAVEHFLAARSAAEHAVPMDGPGPEAAVVPER